MAGSWLVPSGLRLICRNKQNTQASGSFPSFCLWTASLLASRTRRTTPPNMRPIRGLGGGVHFPCPTENTHKVPRGQGRGRGAWHPIWACQMRRDMGEPMPYHVRIYKRRPRTGLVGIGPCLLLVLLHPPSRETNKPEKPTPCGPLLHSLPRWRAPSMVPLSPPRTLMDVTPSRLLASRPRWVLTPTVAAREWRANKRGNSSFPTAPA